MNLAHIKDPLVALLNGKTIDEALNMTTHDRKKLVADDPVAAVEYFHIIISSILHHLFMCNYSFLSKQETNLKKSPFGNIIGYYGMIECQTRGLLHLHVLLWNGD